MSASNWAKCPRCTAEAKKKADNAMAALAAAGLDDGTFAIAGKPAKATFREDYEIYGAETGVVKVTYGGFCEVCHLSLAFEHQHEIPGLAS